MNNQYTFSRFIYFDTNIISYYAKDDTIWPKLFSYLSNNDLTLGIGEGQVSELSDLKSHHEELAKFFISVPTGIIKGWDKLIAEEVSSHPNERNESLLEFPINAILLEENGFENLVNFLSSKSLADARRNQLKFVKQMKSRINQLKSNFPPSKTGKYTSEQADEFAQIQVMQWLASEHRAFLEQFQSDVSGFHSEIFYSIRLFAYVLFYRYYLGQRQPKNLSEFGDLFHLFCIPYCEKVVIERDLCNILNQIKNKHNILENTDIHNIDFVYDIYKK